MKKGQTTMLRNIAIAVLIIGVMWWWSNDTFTNTISATKQLADKDIPNQLYECKQYGERIDLSDVKLDWDQDGLPNSCDNCPLVANKLNLAEPRSGVLRECVKTDVDKDADCFPVNCCGNDGKKGYETGGESRGAGWCSGKKTINWEDEKINDNNPLKHPPYVIR